MNNKLEYFRHIMVKMHRKLAEGYVHGVNGVKKNLYVNYFINGLNFDCE